MEKATNPKPRARKGDGSVFETKDGRHRASPTVRDIVTGKPCRVWFSGKTQTEVRRKMQAARSEAARVGSTPPWATTAFRRHPTDAEHGVVQQGTMLWSDDPIVVENPDQFVDTDVVPGGPSSRSEPDRAATDASESTPLDAFGRVAEAYHRLTHEAPAINAHGYPFRRARPDQPSRPEVAADLGIAPKTVARWCEAADRGSNWPPRDI